MDNILMKKYKPFKMWGSWIGAIIGFPVSIYLMTVFAIGGLQQSGGNPGNISFNSLQQLWFFGPTVLFQNSGINDMTLLNLIVLWNVFLYMTIGFILGWRIEIFFRKNKWFGLK